MTRLQQTGLVLLLALVAMATGPGRVASSPDPAAADTAAAIPEKARSRDTWEYVVNAPFKLAYLPIKILFKGARETMEWTTDNEIPKRVHDFLTSDDGRTGVIPIAMPTKGYGAKLYRRGWISPSSKLSVHARAGRHNRQDYGIEFKRVRFLRGIFTWGFYGGYEFASDERFYGLGMDTDPDDDETNYAHESWQAEVRLGTPLGEHFHIGGEFGVEHNNILAGRGDDSPSTTDEFPGLTGIDDNEVRFGRAGLVLEFDNRDTEGHTSKGWLATLGGAYFTEIDGDDYQFSKLNADVRTYINLFYRRVLMLRLAAELTTEASGKAVPFYHLSELGSYETIRGFSQGRFRGTDAVAATIEYSWPVSHFADFFLFADAGEALPDLQDFESKDVEVGWGGGFRVASQQSVIAKLLFGMSKDEWRVYFALN